MISGIKNWPTDEPDDFKEDNESVKIIKTDEETSSRDIERRVIEMANAIALGIQLVEKKFDSTNLFVHSSEITGENNLEFDFELQKNERGATVEDYPRLLSTEDIYEMIRQACVYGLSENDDVRICLIPKEPQEGVAQLEVQIYDQY